MQGTSRIIHLVIQAFLFTHGVTLVRVLLTNRIRAYLEGNIFLFSPWGRAHISTEMRDAIANLQTVYKSPKRAFTDGTENPSDDSCHTVGRDSQRQPSAEAEASSCHTMVNVPSSVQGNLSDPRSPGSGSKYEPRESVDHRASPPTALVGAEIISSVQPPGLQEICYRYDCVLTELRKDVEHQ